MQRTDPAEERKEKLHMPVTVHAALCARACIGLAALLLLGCNTAPHVAERTSAPVAIEVETPASTPENVPAANDPPAADPANNIYFQLRSTAIDEAEKLKLGAHAERLKADPKARVTLIGHMDDLGSRNYNLAITEERLTEVTRQLRALGVPARQIRRQRAAVENSSPDCKTEACRAPMRRVELKYVE